MILIKNKYTKNIENCDIDAVLFFGDKKYLDIFKKNDIIYLIISKR